MSTWAASRRIPTRFAGLYLFEWVILVNVPLVHAWIYWRGVDIRGPLALIFSLKSIGVSVGGPVVAGVVLRWIWALLRRDYVSFRELWRPNWLISTVRLFIFGALTIHCYGWLKLMIPILNPRRLDATLWNLDRLMFFGISPNVFLLELLASPAVLQTIDFLYAKAFIASLLISIAYFMTAPSERIRVAYATGNAFLWLAGAYLYVAVPALGPAYAFPDVWTPFVALLPESQYWQYTLFQNYQVVLQLSGGAREGPDLNFVYGVAAFPSLHVAFQLYVALWFGAINRYAGIFFRLGVLALFIGSIVTGWHYMIDSIAGAIMAIVVFYAVRKAFGLDRWQRLRHAFQE